jgi:uncharacterized protein YegL
MSKPRDTNIFFILDGSGSMANVQNDVVDGVNHFIKEQKKDDAKTRFWLTVFDTNISKVYDGVDIESVDEITASQTLKGGMTALLDAIGKTLVDAENAKGAKKRENLVIIYTDGLENSSKEFGKTQIAELRKKLEGKGNWTFTFMGADQDAFAEAGQYGFAAANTTSTSSAATLDSFNLLTKATHSHKRSDKSGANASFYR